MRLPRASGILLHPTSFPSSGGIGDLGREARRFVDFLASARQSVWQVLPLGPPGPGYSPYASTSAFAGSPLLISLEDVGMAPGPAASGLASGRVDYPRVTTAKPDRLRAFYETGGAARRDEVESFRAENRAWLDDYALYAALKEAHGGAPWYEWPPALLRRRPQALAEARNRLEQEVGFHAFVQWAFASQWDALKQYAGERGVRIMGDVPIFVAHDSADVWAHPDLFRLDEAGQPTVVAGVPPDYFSPTGQLWGNPLYHWEAMAADGFRWWVERFRHLFRQVDLVRIDHFRGFVAHWTVPAGEPTAVNGRWEPGPGQELFEAIERALGDVAIVAEDLGTITPDVHALREQLAMPGMKVLQFAFGDTWANPYLPHNYEPNCCVYTGTHDNDTTAGWFKALGDAERHRVRRYLATDGQDIAWDMIRLSLSSVADTAIVPLQDVLSLGTEARMNIPGQAAGNWGWRYAPDQLAARPAERLAELTEQYNRVRDPESGAGAEDSEVPP